MYKCPVCLQDSLSQPYKHYSYDICRVCGVEFGFDDAIDESSKDSPISVDEKISANHTKLRKIWMDAGSKNWWDETEKPDFKGGVSWFEAYWDANPLEKSEWERNLISLFKLNDEQ